MHNITLELETTYESKPCYLEIISNKKKIFEGNITKNLKIKFDYPDYDFFELQIIKTGKTLDLVKLKHRQDVYIKSLLLNGFDLHAKKFGMFEQKDNPYTDDSSIQTVELSLNGIWTIRLPIYSILGTATLIKNKFRNNIEDCDIACFGCSFTYGSYVDYNETWPYLLEKELNNKVGNYGIKGSNNQEIFSNALEYSKKFKCKQMILLLCHCSRLQINDTETDELINWQPNSTQTYKTKKVQELIKKRVLYGEDTVLLGGQIPGILETIELIEKNIKTKVYIGFYLEDHYEWFSKIDQLKNRLLPLFDYDKNKFPLAKDGVHPGPLHYQEWVKKIVTILKHDQD